MANIYYVYILSNYSKMLYIGVTNDLERRVYEHKNKLIEGYSKRYNLFQLVYYESTHDIGRAIEREIQLKGWTRAKKVNLIYKSNPYWYDLAADWF